MRAALIEVVGGAPHVETLGDPSPTGDDQVLIKVEAGRSRSGARSQRRAG